MIVTNLEKFIEFITFPFGSVSLTNYTELARDISNADSTEQYHHYDKETFTLWTIKAWIDELKRLKECEKLAIIKPIKSVEALMDDLTLALSVGDLELVKQIQQQIKERQ